MLKNVVIRMMRSRSALLVFVMGMVAAGLLSSRHLFVPSPETSRVPVEPANLGVRCQAESAAEAITLVEQALKTWYQMKTPIQVLSSEVQEDEDGWRVTLLFQEGRFQKNAYQMVRKSWVPSAARPDLDLMGPVVVWSR